MKNYRIYAMLKRNTVCRQIRIRLAPFDQKLLPSGGWGSFLLCNAAISLHVFHAMSDR